MTTYTAEDFANAEFARNPHSTGVGMRKDAGDPNTWCVAYEDPQWRIGIRTDAEMADGGWSPVRECPDPEQHGPVDYKVLLEQAERERDEALDRLAGITIPVPDVTITDDMVETAARALHRQAARPEISWDSLSGLGRDRYRDDARHILTAALTEPPARPEELMRLIDTIREATYDPEPEATGEALYNAGVRVVSEDGAR